MALYRRHKIWWVRFTRPDGQRVRCSTGTEDRQKAQEFHDRQKAQAWEIQKIGNKPDWMWEQAVVRWLKEKAHKATIEMDKLNLRWFDPYLRGVALAAIDRVLIDYLIEQRRAEGVSNASVNRTMEVLRAILRTAANEWEWIERAPTCECCRSPNAGLDG